jgi:hypothetical protein
MTFSPVWTEEAAEVYADLRSKDTLMGGMMWGKHYLVVLMVCASLLCFEVIGYAQQQLPQNVKQLIMSSYEKTAQTINMPLYSADVVQWAQGAVPKDLDKENRFSKAYCVICKKDVFVDGRRKIIPANEIVLVHNDGTLKLMNVGEAMLDFGITEALHSWINLWNRTCPFPAVKYYYQENDSFTP